MKKIAIMLAIVVLSAFGIFGLSACGSNKVEIIISGSSSVSPLMQKLAAEYEKTNNVTIKITTSDSGTGIADTQTSKNEIGMASRALKSTESGVKSRKICDDGVALIVHNNSTVSNVTNQEIYDMYASGTPVQTSITSAITREEGSGTRDAFDSLIKNSAGTALSSAASFASVVSTQNSTGTVMTEVSSKISTIGYISLGSLNNTVKAVKYNGVEATISNIQNGTYSLSRPFNIILKEDAALSEEAAAFVDWIVSSKGQEIVTANGYVAL